MTREHARSAFQRRALPLLVLLAGVLIAFLIVRPADDAVSGMRQLGSWLFEGDRSGSVFVYDGNTLLSRQQTESLIESVVRPRLVDAALVDARTERRGPGLASLICKVRTKDGKEAFFSVAGFDADRGAAIQLRRLLEKAWEFELLCKLGKYPDRPGATLPFLAAGAKQDARVLISIGLEGCTNPDGKFQTWEELAVWYSKQAEARGSGSD